ncbi:MAG: metal-dependent transcriptional regulator [Thermodesulfobacteriota bacterium]
MPEEKVVAEILEFVWTLRERGSDSVTELLQVGEVAETGAGPETLKEMEVSGLLSLDGDAVGLTDKGEGLAREAIRRHRLAELLLSEVLDIEEGSIEEHACSFEHSLSAVVTESICTLLGHPPACPHGLPIPRGDCCNRTRSTVEPLVKALSELSVGESGRITFIVPRTHKRLDKLGTMGLVPGSRIRLHQKHPAFVIEIGETTLALDPDIAREIYVRRGG